MNVKDVAYQCPTGNKYWYRGVLADATIVDYDGDEHHMLVPRWGVEDYFRCYEQK